MLIGRSGFWLFTFIVILIYGQIGFEEQNLAILILEIVVCVAALTLGRERARWLIRKHTGKRKAKNGESSESAIQKSMG